MLLNSNQVPSIIIMTKIAIIFFLIISSISHLLPSPTQSNFQNLKATSATAVAAIDNETLWVPVNATNIQINLVARGYYNMGLNTDTVQLYLIFEHDGMQPCNSVNEGTFKKNCTIPGPIAQSEWLIFKATATSNQGAYSSHAKTVKLYVGDDRIDNGGGNVVIIVALSIGAAVVVLGVGGYVWFKWNQKKKGKKLIENSLQTNQI